MMMRRSLLATLPVLLAACGGDTAHYRGEDFAGDNSHRREFSVSAANLCNASRRVLLGDGYVLEAAAEATAPRLVGTKEYREEKNRHSVLQVHVACEGGTTGATLFVTAVEHHYDVTTSRQSTGIGIPMVGPVTVNTKSESEGQVKTGGETVTDRDFYERFFRAVQQELKGR